LKSLLGIIINYKMKEQELEISPTKKKPSTSNSQRPIDQAIHYLLSILKEEENNLKLVLLTLKQLKVMAKGHDENKLLIGRYSKFLLIHLAHKDVNIQRSCIRLLRSISVIEEIQLKMTDEGCIQVIAEMLFHTKDEPTILGAIAVLWNLSVNDDNKKTIVDLGIEKILIEIITGNNNKLQNEAMGCIRNLSINDGNKVILGRSGAIPPIINLMQAKNQKISKNAVLALRNLALNKENRQVIRDLGAFDILKDKYKEHVDKKKKK